MQAGKQAIGMEQLCALIFEDGTRAFAECVRILNAIATHGYAIVERGIPYYVASKLKAIGLLRRAKVLKCGEAAERMIYVANRSHIARLRLLLESIDVPAPACVNE